MRSSSLFKHVLLFSALIHKFRSQRTKVLQEVVVAKVSGMVAGTKLKGCVLRRVWSPKYYRLIDTWVK